MSSTEALVSFISSEFADGRPVSEDSRLLGELVDSVGLFVLVDFIEKEFKISVTDADLTADNLASVATVLKLIEKRRRAAE
jgi:acyl carrier protein